MADNARYDKLEVPDWPSLSQEEVDALSDRTPVIVLWSGGNGPARYTLVEAGLYRVAAVDWELERERWDYDGKSLSFVGLERFHTRVWTDDGGNNGGIPSPIQSPPGQRVRPTDGPDRAG